MSNGPSARTSHELGTPAMLARTKPTVPTKPNGTAFRSNLHELMWGTRPHSLGQVFEHEVLESCLRQRYRKECRNHACIRLRLVPTELPSDAQTSAKVWRQHLKNIEISVGNDQGVNSPQLIERQFEKNCSGSRSSAPLKREQHSSQITYHGCLLGNPSSLSVTKHTSLEHCQHIRKSDVT